MTSQLRIDLVFAEAFGGLRNRTLVLPDHPLVVVAGKNEAGKSSMAMLIGWLLVGPWGEAALAHRFGNYRDTIGGRLEGRLDGRPVTAEGAFTVINRGAPNENGLTVTHDGRSRTAAAWRTGDLRGIDSTVLQAVYSMAGVDLHQGDLVHRAVSNLSMGALVGSGTALELQEWLETRRRLALKATGKDDRSFAKLTTEINQLRARREALGVDVTEYQQKVDRLREIGARLDDLRHEAGELTRQLDARSAATGALGEQRGLRALEAELAGLDDVSDAWVTVIGRAAEVHTRRSEVERLESECARLAHELDRAAAALGLSDDEISSVQVTAPDVTPITSARSDVRLARAAVDTMSGKVAERRGEVERCEHALRTARAACPDVGIDDLRAVRLDPPTQEELDAAITALGLSEGEVDGARAEVETVARDCHTLDAALAARREHWAAFRPDVSAEEWLANPGRRGAAANTAAPIVDPRIAYGLAAVVTVAAVLALSRPLAAVVALAAIVGAFVVARPRRVDEVDTVDDPAVREAAMAVVDADRRRRDADEAVRRAEAKVGAAEVKRDDASRTVMNLLAVVGVASTGVAAQHRARARAVIGARSALVALDEAIAQLRSAQGELVALETRLAESERALSDALAQRGVPGRIDSATTVDLIADFQAVTDLRVRLAGERATLNGAVGELRSLLAPVAPEVAGLSLADAVARLDAMAELLDRRNDLAGQIAGLRRSIDTRLGTDALARQLVDDDVDEADLAVQMTVLQSQLDDVQAESDSLKRQDGELGEQMRAAEQKDVLIALQMEIGDLEDERDGRLVDGVQALLAKSVLAEVAEEVRRHNQPALVTTASDMVTTVVPDWAELRVDQPAVDRLDVSVRRDDGSLVTVSKLSTGAQAVLYLALRLAAAEHDAETQRNGLRFPILCDDPLVHLDDERAAQAVRLLHATAQKGHQVILFTCNSRTETLAEQAGAVVERFG